MDQWHKEVMDRLDETLIDLALDIGYRMGERGGAGDFPGSGAV